MEKNCILGFDEVFTDGIIVGDHGLSQEDQEYLDKLTRAYIEEQKTIGSV